MSINVIEQLILLSNPKTVKIDASTGRIPHHKRLHSQEVFSALNSAGLNHILGMLIIKAKYLDDKESEQSLCDVIISQLKRQVVDNQEVLAFIINSMILDRPLPGQRKRIKSIYKRFASTATKHKSAITQLENKLSDIDSGSQRNTYRIASLKEQIASENSKLDSYAERQSRTTNHCPACSQSGCEHCAGSGKIAVKMADAQDLFKEIDLPYVSHKFLTEYWTKVLCVVSGLQIEENNVLKAMKIRMELELNA